MLYITQILFCRFLFCTSLDINTSTKLHQMNEMNEELENVSKNLNSSINLYFYYVILHGGEEMLIDLIKRRYFGILSVDNFKTIIHMFIKYKPKNIHGHFIDYFNEEPINLLTQSYPYLERIEIKNGYPFLETNYKSEYLKKFSKVNNVLKT